MKKALKQFNWHLLIVVMYIMSFFFIYIAANPTEAAGTTYYVAKTGADTNPGTAASPWLTIDHAVDTIAAGDTILVRSGTYNELVTITTTGTLGNVCTLQAYPGETVKIDGAGLTTSYGIVYLVDVSYWTIDGFELQNLANGVNAQAGVMYRRTAGTRSNVTLQNLIIHDVADEGIKVDALAYGNITDLTIDNVEVYNTNSALDQEAISISYVNRFEIKNCYLHGTNPKEGIDVKDGTSNGSIHDNVINNSVLPIYVDGNNLTSSNISIYNNVVYGSPTRTGIAVGAEGTGGVSTINIYNNIVYGMYNGIAILDYGSNVNTSVRIYNNTIYNSSRGIHAYGGAAQYVACTIQNNIVYATTYADTYSIACDDTTNITIDHNLVYNSYGDHSWIAGQDAGADVINNDPFFVSLTVPYDFHITSTSPAKDWGSATAAPSTDFDGTARPQGVIDDIGAYEYFASSGGGGTPGSPGGGFSGIVIVINNNSATTYTYPQIKSTSMNNTQLINDGYASSSMLDVQIASTGGASLPMMPTSDNGTWFTTPSIPPSSYTSFLWSSGNVPKTSHQMLFGNGGYATTLDNAALEPGNDFELTTILYLLDTGTYYEKQDSIKVAYNATASNVTLTVGNETVPDYTLNATGIPAGYHTIKVAAGAAEGDLTDWLEGFNYRKKFTITGSTAGNLTNYPLQFTAIRAAGADSGNTTYLGTACQADFDDIRFTTSDGITKLDYWLQTVSGTNATVWVEFNSVPASPATTDFYIYYGDSDAASESTAVGPMTLEEDFDGGFDNTWTVTDGTWTRSNTSGYGGTGGYTASSIDGDQHTTGTPMGTYSAWGLQFGYRVKFAADAQWHGTLRFNDSAGGIPDEAVCLRVAVYPENVGGDDQISFYATDNTETANVGGFVIGAGTWYYVTGTIDQAGNVDIYFDGAPAISTTTTNELDLTHIQLSQQSVEAVFDDIWVAPFTSPDPTITAWEGEASVISLYVDDMDDPEDSEALASGLNDNANSWVWYPDPYYYSIELTVGSTDVLLYQPVTLITGDNLPDRTGTAQNATITWGTADLSGNLTSFTPPTTPTPTSPGSGGGFIPTPSPTGSFTITPSPTFPGAEVINDVAGSTPLQIPWMMITGFIILVASLVSSWIMRRFGSGSIFVKAGIIFAGMCVLIGLNVYDLWMLIFFVIVGVALLMASRQPTWGN